MALQLIIIAIGILFVSDTFKNVSAIASLRVSTNAVSHAAIWCLSFFVLILSQSITCCITTSDGRFTRVRLSRKQT